jgi:hypothetical protein
MAAAWRLARSNISAIDRTGDNTEKQYYYSTMGDYAAAVEDGLAAAGLVVVVETVTPRWSVVNSKSGAGFANCVVVIRGHVYHDGGGSLPFQFPGESRDTWDKSLYKSVTGARKYALACLFNLKGGTDPEADAEPEGGQAAEPAKAATKAKAAAKAEPPRQKVARELIRETVTAAQLGGLLTQLIEKYPVTDNVDVWARLLADTEAHIATWDPLHQNPVMAVVYGVRATLAGAAADAPAVPAGAKPVADAPPCPSLESLVAWVEEPNDPAGLVVTLEDLLKSPRCQPIRNNVERFDAVVDHAKLVVETNLHNGTWQEADVERALTVLSELTKAVNTAKQMKEATSGNG